MSLVENTSDAIDYTGHIATMAATTWSSDIRLTNDPGKSIKPKMAADSEKNIHVAWMDNIAGQGPGIYYKKLDSNGNTLINTKKIGDLEIIDFEIETYDSPAICMGPSDTINIAWIGYNDYTSTQSPKELVYKKMDKSGNDIIGRKRILLSASLIRSPDVASNSKGEIYFVWEGYASINSETYYSKINANAQITVNNRRITSDGTSASGYPKIAADAYNNIHMIWGGGQIHYTMINDNGVIIVDNMQLSNYLPTDPHTTYMPDIAVDSTNNIHAVWTRSKLTGPDGLDYIKLDHSGNILVNHKLILSSVNPSHPEIAISPDNRVHLIWDDQQARTDINYEIYYLILDNSGNTLQSKSRVTYDGAVSSYPDISVDVNNKVHIVWSDKRDGNFEIYYKEINPNNSPWRSAGGFIKSDPFIISDDRGHNHILAVGGDDALWDYTGGQWYKLWGGLTSNLYAMRKPIPGGDIHVFARGLNGGLWDCEFVATTSGPDEYWRNLQGGIISDPSVAADPNQSGRLSVAVKGTDNALWINDIDTTSIWGLSWVWNSPRGFLKSNPRVIFDSQGKRHTFVRGGDGALWDNEGVWTGSGYNSNWHSLGGVITSDPKPLKPLNTPNSIYVFARGNDGALWVNFLDTTSELGQWKSFGGYLSTTREAPIPNMENPEPFEDSAGNTHIFVEGGDKALQDCVLSPSGSYSWNGLGGYMTSNPAAGWGEGNMLDIAVRGGDGALWIYAMN